MNLLKHLGTFLLLTSTASANGPVTISSGEYPPFATSKNQDGGIVDNVIKSAFKNIGKDIQIKYLPWARSKEQARLGKFQATSYWQCTEKLQRDFYCSDSVITLDINFFFLKRKPLKKWNSLDDLKELKIGATRGYEYKKILDKAYLK